MISYKEVQVRLKATGFDPGAIDGLWGGKTMAALMGYAAARPITDGIRALAIEVAAQLPKFQINTPLRVCHFLAQTCHETQGFRWLHELGDGKDANHNGFDDYLERYDFRKDLGNGDVGDGDRYRGRGLIMNTGEAHYRSLGKRMGVDLIAGPVLLETPKYAVLAACLFWDDHGLNGFADTSNLIRATKIINGGTNGLVDRQAILKRLTDLWGF